MNDSHVFDRVLGRPRAVSATGCTVVDGAGVEYLDGAGGAIASSIGHGRREVVDAMAGQAASVEYVHATQFSTEAVERFADRLAAVVPVDDARVFPVSGGSEANETALKLARSFHVARGDHERHVVLARVGAYHGNSRGALDASDRSGLRAAYEPWLGQTVRVPMANPYRDCRSGADHAAEIDRIIRLTGPDRVAAFIAEPVSGATLGAVVPPADYWPAVAAVCREHGVLLILDEVMTGFGRTGEWFAADHWGVRPDIVTAGKGASSGYWPLGVCVASGEVYDTVTAAATFAHGFTWSHHPVGAAVASTVIDVIEREELVVAARRAGDLVRDALRSALSEHPNVGDIRGLGLLNAVEFVADPVTKAPFDRSDRVIERITTAAFDRRLTVYPCSSAVDGAVGDAALLGPALCATDDELHEMVARLVAATLSVLPA
ncbi:MAG: aminotransferase class III-fold pyridoxal phosphate-dependent enzyme [Ilumatobacteraceae bacterium]|nr:aminotransferase class III-fold pyridoxal phosphate-dependent enzyme [Ilumatobacteraceae bacterium]